MSITAAQPATTPIPVQLSEAECTACVLSHLSMPKRGPKYKLGSHRVFNLILWLVYTGMEWKRLSIPHDVQGKPTRHYTTIGLDHGVGHLVSMSAPDNQRLDTTKG